MEVTYNEDFSVAYYNNHKFRQDKKTGYYLSSKPLSENSKGNRGRLHRYIWETEVGEIPKGFEVHHIDHNKLNNCVENYELLLQSVHHFVHMKERTQEQLQKARDNMQKNVRPKADIWHGSEAGREWHRKHGIECWEKRTEKEYICSFCGKPFMTLNRYSEKSNHFCSNNCKSAFRRASHIDDITKKCERCGNEFITNKYSKARFCQSCHYKKH